MAIDGDRFDAAKEITSDHVGGRGPELKNYDRYVTAGDCPIYGVECHFERERDGKPSRRGA